MILRVGLGYDIHPFSEDGGDRALFLGGVEIPGMPGLRGHSDADVLLHSICDAVLGALGLGDLGRHFSDKDPSFEGISSRVLLEKVAGMMSERGFRVVNLDAVVIAQKPRLVPHLERMRTTIAAILGVGVPEVNIKGTSPESIGSLGDGQGIAAETIVLLGKD